MGGLLFVRMLAGLVHDLTTVEIRLQLTDVFCSRQTSQAHAVLPFALHQIFLFPLVSIFHLSFFTWTFPHIESVLLLQHWNVTLGCVGCVSCLRMTWLGKNESPLEGFVLSHSKFFWYLFLSICFLLLTTAMSHLLTERELWGKMLALVWRLLFGDFWSYITQLICVEYARR